MASTYCWPSVSIKRGASLVVVRKVVKAEYGCILWMYVYTINLICFIIQKNYAVIGLEKIILIFILPTYRPYVYLFFARET